MFFLGAHKVRATGKQWHRAKMKFPQERIFEAVPKFVAGCECVHKRVQRQQHQRFGCVNLLRELTDDGGVVEVAQPRQAGLGRPAAAHATHGDGHRIDAGFRRGAVATAGRLDADADARAVSMRIRREQEKGNREQNGTHGSSG